MTTTRTMTAAKLFFPLCLTAAAVLASAIHENPHRAGPIVEIELDAASGEQQQQHPLDSAPSSTSSSSSATSTATHAHTHAAGVPAHEQDCGVWLAPSTIKGAGLGMFAGRPFAARDVLLPTGDSVIGIIDIMLHQPQHTEAFLWDEYTWSGRALRLDREGYHEVNVASAGFGAAVNCFLPVVNADELNPVLQWEGLRRDRDPGAGASTQYHNRLSVAQRPIAAGEEFFVTYGEDWFTSRPSLGPIPLYDDLDRASALLQRFDELSMIQNETILADVWKTFVTDTRFIEESRVLAAFRRDESPFALQQTFRGNMTAARIADSRRSLDWLREHGTCGDHIVAGKSTIPQAGHGAFAARPLPKDAVVAQLPMIHLTNRTRLDMYHLKVVNKTWVPDERKGVVGQQLLLNYCYGHGESSLLLCPYGPMTNYINHNRTSANVRMQWGRPETGNHMPELLNATVKDIEKSDSTAKLAMELVATRDIQKGEEILMDYGSEWEAAWNAHVANWRPPRAAKTAAELNGEAQLRTIFEEYADRQYPANVELFCDTGVYKPKSKWKAHYANGTLEEYLLDEDAHWWPCEILRYKTDPATGDVLYTMHMFEPEKDSGDEQGTTSTTKQQQSILVEDVPRAIFHFRDRPYTSDTFLPTAFRHDIRIPDALFPQAWRNLVVEESKAE